MEKKIISFKGISNVPDDGLNEAWDMAVLMNMRHKGGELVPCQPPTEELDDIGTVEQALYHANSGYWLVLKDDGSLSVRDGKLQKVTSVAEGGNIVDSGVQSFALMGNIVIMNFADRVEYAIWRDANYEYLGGLPKPPELGINITVRTESVKTSIKYSFQDDDYDYDNKWIKHSKGYFDECLALHYNKGRYIDNALFIVALKLFDGTYCYSQLYLARNNDDSILTFLTDAFMIPSGDRAALMEAIVAGFDCDFTLAYDLSKWEDVISSVCVFTSGSIMKYKPVKKNVYTKYANPNIKEFEDLGVCEFYAKRMVFEIREDIETCNSFYKIAEYDLLGNEIYAVSNTSPSNIVSQDKMTTVQPKRLIGGMCFEYNNRLHTFGYQEEVNIASDNVFVEPGKKPDSVIKYDTSIELSDGSVIKYEIKTMPTNAGDLPVLISHPQKGIKKQIVEDALNIEFEDNPILDMSLCLNSTKELDYKVDFLFVSATGDTFMQSDTYLGEIFFNIVEFDVDKFLQKTEYKTGNYVLQQSVSGCLLNGSATGLTFVDYGITLNGRGLLPSIGSCAYVAVTKTKTKYNIAKFHFVDDVTIKDEKQIKSLSNILKVSAVDNPFYFPTAQTYKFEGEIKGLASNAEAISTGQFGQYPLFVFTDTGIWAMQVDTSGQGAYTTQSPFSREVCNGAICQVSGGVVFSTDKGVMVISGGQVADLSAALDGFEVDFFEENADMWNAIFAKAGKNAVVNPVPIREYIQGESGNVKGESRAKLAYNYLHNEVILSNVNYGYSYVYSLTNKVWSVIDVVFDLTTNKYPELVVFDKGNGAMYTFEDGAAQNKVVAITRPFTLGSIDFKRIRQAGLRTTFNGQLNFYVLGSIDGAEFKCITGKEATEVKGESGEVKTRRDLITAMSRSKQYKYFVIAVVGNIKGRVSMAELLVDMGFANNKIR